MKFNNNNNINDETKMDNMNIKSHLNTSLDLSGISVSEDLINRTLEAIKQQQVEQKVDQKSAPDRNKKVIPWNRYVRGFAGVAAAVLIVAVGYNAISRMGLDFSSKKESTNSSEAPDSSNNQIMMDQSAEDSVEFSKATDTATATEESVADTAGTEPQAENNVEDATQYTIMADTLTTEDGVAITAKEDAVGEVGIATPEAKVSVSLRSSDEEAVPFTFRDIFLPAPEQAEYVMISDELNNTAITLTSQDEILDFYSVMDQYQFNYATEDATEQNYTVEVKTPQQEEASYTLTVGKSITVRYIGGDTISQSIYNVVDEALFKQSLDEFYKKYSE